MPSILSIILAVLPSALAIATIDKRQTANTIPGSWIAILEKDGDLATVLSTLRTATPVTPKHEYSIGNFKGFAFDGDESVLDTIANFQHVQHIEPDQMMFATAPVSIPDLESSEDENAAMALTTQSSAEYGLARISHKSPGSTSYIYDSTAGSGVTIYVIDTGVYAAHSEFGGRATVGANFISAESAADGNGHGTHCSGTAAGTTYGVAKRANIIGVKVLASDGRGANSGVLSGIDWAVSNAQANGRTGRSVISMSLGGGFSQASNNAVAEAVAAGIFTAVAAGNDGVNAANTSPASTPTAFTVGATDSTDTRGSFSNFGSVLDIFAPGVNVKSAWIGGTTTTRTISGTSMACPHVAGLAAYLIGLEGTRTPAALGARIQSLSNKNLVKSPGSGSPNYLAYNGNGA